MKVLYTTAAALLLATSANAATVLLDDFNSNQVVVDLPTGMQQSASQLADASVLGGFRDIQAVTDDGVENATQVAVRAGTLGFSNTAGQSGTGFLTYDGDDDAATVDTDGLGGFDLTFGGLGTGFVFDVLFSDASLLLTINAWDTGTGFSSFQATFPALTSGVFAGSFDAFVGDADLSNLGALQFVAGGNGVQNLDAQINSIGVNVEEAPPVVPLPASALLLGGALAGAAAFGRRRKAS